MKKITIKTSLRGFTLIELLVVIAIIGLLSTAIMGPVQTGLKKGRDTRKISDLTQVQGALLQYAGDNNGTYPFYLGKLDPTYMKADPNMFSESAARDRMMYVSYVDAAGNIVAYHLGTALENQNASLQGDVDCGMKNGVSNPISSGVGAVVTAGDWGGLDGSAMPEATVPCINISNGALNNSNWSVGGAGNPKATASTTDFGGKGLQEEANGVCTSKLDTCVYDVVPK